MDPILAWNEVALEANRVSHTNGLDEQTGPTLSSRALAIVHLAMYDAYAGVINDATNLPRYIAGSPSPVPGASANAAVAAAAHATLSDLFPSQKPSLISYWRERVTRPIRDMLSDWRSPRKSLLTEQATPGGAGRLHAFASARQTSPRPRQSRPGFSRCVLWSAVERFCYHGSIRACAAAARITMSTETR